MYSLPCMVACMLACMLACMHACIPQLLDCGHGLPHSLLTCMHACWLAFWLSGMKVKEWTKRVDGAVPGREVWPKRFGGPVRGGGRGDLERGGREVDRGIIYHKLPFICMMCRWPHGFLSVVNIRMRYMRPGTRYARWHRMQLTCS